MAKKQGSKPPPWLRVLVRGLAAVGRFVDRFGVSFSVLVLLLFTVWSMGTAKTQDDFVRELLFGSVTGNRYLGVIATVLAFDAIFGFSLLRKKLVADNKEIKRLTAERDRLQELLTGRSLSHTPLGSDGEMK